MSVPQQEAVVPASNLGEAFQLTNFIRDVGEDLDRGRLYLPAGEFAAFGVDIEMLEHGRRTETVDVRVKRAGALHRRDAGRYRTAESGIPMLDRRVQPSIRTAFVLYGAILDQVERADFRILHRRVSVPGRTRLRVAAPGLVRSATYAAKNRMR
ncbi:phytoene/squalene synthase family protein [Rhodococcus sp. 3Y1]